MESWSIRQSRSRLKINAHNSNSVLEQSLLKGPLIKVWTEYMETTQDMGDTYEKVKGLSNGERDHSLLFMGGLTGHF